LFFNGFQTYHTSKHFKSSGPGWQTRIDSTLREAIKRRA
jgi:uncharacterized protein (DUF4415 family)